MWVFGTNGWRRSQCLLASSSHLCALVLQTRTSTCDGWTKGTWESRKFMYLTQITKDGTLLVGKIEPQQWRILGQLLPNTGKICAWIRFICTHVGVTWAVCFLFFFVKLKWNIARFTVANRAIFFTVSGDNKIRQYVSINYNRHLKKLRKRIKLYILFVSKFLCCRVGTQYTWSNFIYNLPDISLIQ